MNQDKSNSKINAKDYDDYKEAAKDKNEYESYISTENKDFKILFEEGTNSKKLIGHKRKNSAPLKENEEEKEQIKNKKIKSEECKKLKNEKDLFIFKKMTNFLEIFDLWGKNIKSLKINESGEIISKLKDDELILNNCKRIAIEKIKNIKFYDIKSILNILSYDNIDKNVLYYCLEGLKRVSKKNEFNKLLRDYKYGLCDEINIVDYSNQNKIIKKNLRKEFNYKFPFASIDEGINVLKQTIENLINLVNIYNEYAIEDKLLNFENKLVFQFDDINKIKAKGNNELYNKGLIFLKNYAIIKEFDNYNNNQPYSYENNEILYISFLLNEIYKSIIIIEYNTNNKDEPNNSIIIKENYFIIIFEMTPLLKGIIKDLENKNINKEFTIKIRFFNILFDIAILNSKCYELINRDFLNHFFNNNKHLKEKEINEIIKIKKTNDLIAMQKKNKYSYENDTLYIKYNVGSIQFNLKDYGEQLKDILLTNDLLLSKTWELNYIMSFQKYNFLLESDIIFLKKLLKIIFQSSFWEELLNLYSDNTLINNKSFRNEKFIEQFFERVVFIPFSPNNVGIFGYTTSEDLLIFIPGYQCFPKNIGLEDYLLYRMLNMGILVIIFLHESIHYYKRLLYLITCKMISRLTIINEERQEGGWIFEKILLGWDNNDEKKEKERKKKPIELKKINIEIALSLLDPNTFRKNIEYAKNRIVDDSKDDDDKIDELLMNYLKENGLGEKDKLDKFLHKNQNKYINASRDACQNDIEYFSSDHRNNKL